MAGGGSGGGEGRGDGLTRHPSNVVLCMIRTIDSY